MPQRNDRSRSTPTTSPKNNSWFRMQAGHQSDADIYIYDEIGFWGVTAKQFISDLNALGDITHINLHINSPGGDVFEGIAIFNALKTHGASITVYVDGVAASMASVIAMVGNPVIMPENTFMMIHKPFGFTGGDAEDMRTYADLLDKVEAVLLPAYAQKTGKTTDEIAAMLADETWMSGAECLAHGFADQVTPAVKAMACIQSKRTEEFKKMPESIRNMITPPRNSAPRVQDDEPAASRTPVQAAAPVVDENSIRAQVTEFHLGKELLEKVELTEDNASRLEEFSKEWKDASDKWNAMWGIKIEQTKDGKHYVAGIGLSMEDTEEGKLSQFLVAANRIAFIDPSNGNTRPMFVGQGDQIFMNDVFLKRLTAPTITSGGNPPAFSLTPDGRLTAKNADISGNVNANSGTLNNVTINENCRVLGKLSANQIEGDLVKTVGKAFPRDSRAPERWPSGTITVRVYDDQPFDRQIVIPAVAFSGAKHEREHTDIYSSCRLIVRKNGAEIYNRTALDNTLIYSGVIDMPAGHGHMTLEFSVSAWLVNDWYPTASISDLLVVVMKKATAGISIS
ncbi:head maturation protease, ClpP-related [Escherichia coli]|uniref:head maturation protease, ClpP-related n=1 Tax=Escherichia coli TaxID=562 RepID=UPI001C9ABD3F|nr:head maturation protease, ClpP-related [Escherichia coli]MBY7234184.1 ATP-dependent Clp protease proteolytic subunit [Escherichia coli]